MSVHPDAREAFERMKEKKSHPFLIYRLDSTLEEIVLDTPPIEPSYVLRKGEEQSFDRNRFFKITQLNNKNNNSSSSNSHGNGNNGDNGGGRDDVHFGSWNKFPDGVRLKILTYCHGQTLFALAVTSKSFWTIVMCREVWRPATLGGLQTYISKSGNSRTPVLHYTYAWKDYFRYLRVRDYSEEIFFDYDPRDTPQKRWRKFKITVPLTVSRYATVWFEYKTEKGKTKEELLLITCVPAGATARDKLDYLAEREGLKESFDGVTRDFLVRDEEELDYDNIRKRCIKEDGKTKKLIKSRKFY